MNYLEIVVNGYFTENNRKFLVQYFLREFKKAAKDHFFEADEFFSGCLGITKTWEDYLQDKVFEQQRRLSLMLGLAKDGELNYSEMEGKTIEQKRNETIEYAENELKDVRPDGIGSTTFFVQLAFLTNGSVSYNMTYFELLTIKEAIFTAYEKVKSENKPPENNVSANRAESKSELSVLEWACIFYYAYEAKLLEEKKYISKAVNEFHQKNGLTTSPKSLKNEYHNVKNRINKTSDFPIHKLQKILPYCKANYNKALERIKSDINYIKKEQTEY